MRGIPLIYGVGLALAACARPTPVTTPAPEPVAVPRAVDAAGLPRGVDRSRQLVVVTTSAWDATTGTLLRYTRELPGGAWTRVGNEVPVVIGRTGLAWGDERLASTGEPVKHEGDGKSPAGLFPLDTAFGFAPRDSMDALRVPYVPLQPGSDCVDDEHSAYYNTVVDRARVTGVDWNSAEHMRQISVYRLGVIVGYNAAPPVRGRGSCIFLHIWSGPTSTTAGCTAFDAGELRTLVTWLDRDRRPMIVQVPASAYGRVAARWNLPAR